jgi:TrpR family trp operon transcriptional repressor
MIKDPELVAANISEMSRALSGADPTLVEEFLYSLFTSSEADEIAKRWALVKQIADGRPQREIAKDLGLSLCKITRGSRELKKESSAFKRMLVLAGIEIPATIARRRTPRRATPTAVPGQIVS